MKKLSLILLVSLFLPISAAQAFCLGSFCFGSQPSTKPSLPYSVPVEIVQSPFYSLQQQSFLRDFNRFVNSVTARPVNPSTLQRLNGASVPLDSYYTRATPQQQEQNGFLSQSQARVYVANQNANNALYQVVQNTRPVQNTYVSVPFVSTGGSGGSGSSASSERGNQRWCMDDYGPHSVWQGALNDTDGPVCGCEDGYEFKSEGAWCTAIGSVGGSSVGGSGGSGF